MGYMGYVMCVYVRAILCEQEGDEMAQMHRLRRWATPSVQEEGLSLLIGIQNLSHVTV